MRTKERNPVADESDGQGGEHEKRGQSSFEYLAAQACLGNQTASATDIVSLPNPNATKPPGAHSHSNSHSTTATRTLTTKSSKSHSRNNSIGNSGVHGGRVTVSKLCGNMGLDVDLDLDQAERANLLGNSACAQGANIKPAPDLEGALKRHGTKVIRLADPAHIPVDKGLPVSQPVSPNPLVAQNQRSPSPDLSVSNLSAISQSKVGIAIGTPPDEEGSPTVVPAGLLSISTPYVPSHPYAQGGLSFSFQTPSGREIDSRNPSAVTGSNVLPLSEILARHKVSPHPYAISAGNAVQDQSNQPLGINVARDSYLSTNGLMGQFRSGDRRPDPSRMWAQLSPDVLREILPGDLQYSPYDSDVEGIENLEGTKVSRRGQENDRMRSIHDTAGVTEALLSTTAYERRKKEERKDEDRIGERMDSSPKVQPNDTDFLVVFNDLHKPSHASSAHTIASSHLDAAAKSTSTRLESLDALETASRAPTSGSPSLGFRLLGSPNDLDSFQDLFYQPDIRDSPASPGGPDAVSWDAAVRNRRTGSSLTSLTRQLSEYEALVSADATRASSMQLHSRTRSLGVQRQHSGLSTEGNSLQFDMASGESPHRMPNVYETVHAFESANLPEDVYSLHASSITDGNGEDDDPTGRCSSLAFIQFTQLVPHVGLLRLGTVESVSTPAAVDVEHRISFNGETVFEYQDQDSPETGFSTDIDHPGNAVSRRDPLPFGLSSQRPLTQVTRSSYMTTSDLSRISGLSDFPVPPKSINSESSLPTPTPHIPVLSTYFEGGRNIPPNPSLLTPEYVKLPRDPVTPHGLFPQGGQVEFGVDQSAVELARSLSSPDPV